MSGTVNIGGEDHPVTDVEDAMIALEDAIKESEAIVRMSESEDFKVFEKAFVENYTKTALANAHNFTEQGDDRFLLSFKARSVLLSFIREQKENILSHKADLKELREILEEDAIEH